MKQKRLFLGIPINDQIKDLCRDFIENQKLKTIWIPENNWHITIIFIGNFPESKIRDLTDDLIPFFSTRNAFSVVFSRFYYQSDRESPRMIWGKFNESESFNQLIRNLYSHLQSFYMDQRLNFRIKIRHKNIPHITLSRLKTGFNPVSFVNPFPEHKVSCLIDKCLLYESVLLPKGAKYKVLHDFSFVSKQK